MSIKIVRQKTTHLANHYKKIKKFFNFLNIKKNLVNNIIVRLIKVESRKLID